jgi:hypothetical protein
MRGRRNWRSVMRVIARAAAIVAVILCGSVAMLSLWSWRAVPSRRADARVPSGWRRSPPLPYQRLQVNLDLGERVHVTPTQPRRDPFRFYVRRATLTPHITAAPPPPATFQPALPVPTAGAPMHWKFMGIVQRNTRRWAVFSDCRSIPVPITAGGLLEGHWRVTAIGVESVTLRTLDDREIVLPLRGCQPR